jgi:hypothetical protein
MNHRKVFKSSVKIDFSKIRFYEIPFFFFEEWLSLTVEISKIIDAEFQLVIPKKRLDWYNSPDREVFDSDLGISYILRTSSAILKGINNAEIHVVAQYGYENIPGQSIIMKPKLAHGNVFSQSFVRDNSLILNLEIEEKHLLAIEEVFYIFQ